MRRLLSSLAVAAVAAVAALAACTNQPFTVDVPLRVVATSPSAGAKDIARKAADGTPAAITVNFSEELDPATVTAANFALTKVGADGTTLTAVPLATGTPKFATTADGAFQVTLLPAARLDYSQLHRLTLSTGIKRKRDGGFLPTTVHADFTTEDPPPLAVVFAKPSQYGSGVTGATTTPAVTEREPTLIVRFSEPVDCKSIAAAGNVTVTETFDAHPHTTVEAGAASRPVPGTWKCNDPAAANPERLEGSDCLKDTDPNDPASECVITFQPTDATHPLVSFSSTLVVALKGGKAADKPVQSARATAAGGQLPATTSESSSAIDPPALALSASSPANGATGAARDSAITLTFSEPVDCAQLQMVAKIEEVRDAHPHVPAPSVPEGTTPPQSLTRQLWPAVGGTTFGTWTCPDLSAVDPTDHSCGTDGSRCVVVFNAKPDTGNALVADQKAFEYSSTVRVTLPGGAYADSASLASRASVESARATSKGGELASTVVSTFRTEDPPTLALAGVAPASGAHGVPRDAAIRLVFSEPVDCAALQAAATLIEVRDSNAHIPAPVQLASGSLKTRQLWPAVGGATSGTWTCPSAATDGTCGAGGAACVVTFKPAADTNNALEGADTKALEYSSTVILTLAGAAYVGGTAPSARVVESGRATTFGGELTSTQTVTFVTEDPPAMALSLATPGPAATFVPLLGVTTATNQGASLTLDFSATKGGVDCALLSGALTVTEVLDPMVQARLTAASASNPVAGALVNCHDGDARITWQASPVAGAPFAFSYSSKVQVQVVGGTNAAAAESGIATNGGGSLPATLGWSFSIVDPPPLRILRFSPSDQAVNIAASAALQVVFDQAVDPATIIFTGAGATLSASEVTATLLRSPATSPQTLPAVAAAASALSADKLTATFVPAVPAGATTAFGASSTVTFSAAGTIQSGIATSKGGQLQLSPGGSAVTAAFRIQDPSPLAVGGTEPNGDPGANASATSDILVSFSRDVFCGTSAAGTGFFASPQSALLVTDCGATQPSVGVDCSTTGTQIPVKAITCSPGAGGLPSTVRFTPLAAMTPNDWIQVKLGDVALKNGQVAANDATIVNGTVYGQLGAAPFTFQFKVGLEPLQILSTIPPQFANTTTSPTLTLHTNFGVDPSTLKQCTAFASGAATPAGCNYFLTTKLTSGVPDVTGGLYASALTAGLSNGDLAITTSTPLANNATYGLYLCATSSSTTCTSAPNPIRAQGVNAVLLSNFQLIFTTGSAIVSVVRVANGAQAANTSGALTVPAFPSPATGVSVDPASPMVCATFVGALSASTWSASNVSVSFTPDVFGQTINVPLTNFTAAGNVGCFDFDVTAIDDALGGKRQLLYNTKFNGSIGTGVVASGTSGLTPFQFAFKTQGAPSILGSFATNSVVNTSRILHGEADMPFTPNLFVLFGNGANPSAYPGLLASSLTSTSVQLLQGATSVAITAQVAPGNPNALQVTPNAPLSPLTTYTLVLQGGAGGISDVNGNFLESTTRYTFVTSPQTTAVISPAETAIDSEIQIPFIFSRNLYLPSATNAAISATVGGKAAQGVIAENASTPRTVTFIASPTWPNNTVTPIIVSSNGAVLDERGNAVAPVTRSWTGTGNLSAITSKAPTAPTAASVAAVCPSPTTPGATVDCGTFGTPAIPTAVFGDQAFRITFGGTGLQQRILPSSVSSASVSLAPTAPEPVTCTLPSGQATGQPIPLRFTFAAGSSLTADAVIVSARDPRLNPAHRLASGCLYALTVDPAKIANLYGVAGAAGSAFQISLLGGVGTPAGTGSVTTSSGTQATLGSSTTTQVAGNTTVTMTFAAQAQSGTQVGADIDPATVNASTVPVTASTGASPAGTYAVEGNVVTFTLAGPPNWFSTGVTYTAAVTAGVKDFAGHAAAASSAAFTTSSTVPTVVSGSVAYVTVSSGAAAGLVNGAFVAKLSEGVRPETLTPSTATPAFTGAFDVKCGGATIYGALGVDLADPTRIVFQPAYHTVSGGASCTVTLSTGVKDYEGVGIASPSATTLTVPSTP